MRSAEASIIAMNNRGARSMTVGDLHSAIDHLSSALHTSRTSLPHIEQPNFSTFDVSVWMGEGYHIMKATVENDEMYQSLKSSDFIYSSPVQVPASDFSVLGLHVEVALVSIVVFNLALAHHLLAIQTHTHYPHLDRTGSQILAKAMKLYELAIRLQQDDATLCSANFSGLFILSSLNNLGDVHRLLGDERASEYCYQQLQSLLMYLSYRNKSSTAPLDYSIFFKNTMQQNRNAGPAA
jgi:hypothetical protein